MGGVVIRAASGKPPEPEQRQGMTHQGIVAMVAIECGGSFVPLGSGGNERGRIGASGANCRVGERADMPIVIPQVDGEATELSGGNKLIGCRSFGDVRWQLPVGNARRRQSLPCRRSCFR